MHFDLSTPGQLSAALGPELLLVVGAMVLLLWAVWGNETFGHQRAVGLGAIVLCFLALAVIGRYALVGRVSAGPGIIAVDNFRWASDLIILGATIITIALSIDYERREGTTLAESHVLVLFATAGMMLLVASRDLIMIFLGIELMSLSTYVLAGLNRRSPLAAEASLKYFLLGAFSTAFLLYGIALIYGAAGTTNLAAIGAWTATPGQAASPMLAIGIGLLIVGFGFKVSVVPFHMWAPDVYDGAPTPYSAYMAAGVKAAAFAAFLRIWIEALPNNSATWHAALWWLAVITMIGGNLIALQQRNIKRLIAYSSVAHAGYLLVAVVVGTAFGASSFLFYLVAYTLATMGAFAVVIAVGRAGEPNLDLDDYAGLWRVRPWLALAMGVFMLALLGFPLFGGMGFFAKWYVLLAALRAPVQETTLAVILVLASAVSAGYYLRVVKVMFMNPHAGTEPEPAPVPVLTQIMILAAAILLLVWGVAPNAPMRMARWGIPTSAAAEAPATPLSQLDR